MNRSRLDIKTAIDTTATTAGTGGDVAGAIRAVRADCGGFTAFVPPSTSSYWMHSTHGVRSSSSFPTYRI